ncbi:MAG: tRNA-(ms[2]io[6]A)-hydroxylase [Polyangiaceae bacterium]|nr:tRNA-(ms[2]io[6]A)-hydroxylase [Polyangiaceae bacterium]
MLCLKAETAGTWAGLAAQELDRVLIDHAHCEMKAASNALSLVARHPDEMDLVRALSELAAEELDHFRRVVTVLEARGLTLGTPPVDTYAALLRNAAASLPSRHRTRLVLVDRLLVGALIEARSCERFKLLLPELPKVAPELVPFYEELFACEAKHFRTYVDLAKLAAREDANLVDGRLDTLATLEAQIIRDRALPSPTVHG